MVVIPVYCYGERKLETLVIEYQIRLKKIKTKVFELPPSVLSQSTSRQGSLDWEKIVCVLCVGGGGDVYELTARARLLSHPDHTVSCSFWSFTSYV
jgi:hypothetical protein